MHLYYYYKFYTLYFVTLSACHTLADIINGHLTENKIFNPFVSVHMRFLYVSNSAMAVPHSSNALLVR